VKSVGERTDDYLVHTGTVRYVRSLPVPVLLGDDDKPSRGKSQSDESNLLE
jgi:hypothetical protein